VNGGTGGKMKVSVHGVTFFYGSIRALDNVTFEVHEGEILGVTGPNGSGKTTLLKCINGVLRPRMGSVLINEVDLLQLDRKEVAKRIGVVPQGNGMFFPFTVLDVVLMGRTPHLGRLERETAKDLEIAENAMRLTNTLHLADRFIDEISGGERQRVFIARALAQEPKILLLDEPTSHLDLCHQLEILELIRELAKNKGLTVIMVSHDLALASRYCDKLLLLSSGRIYSAGSPSDVLTRENIRNVYKIDVEVEYNERTKSMNIIPISPIPPSPDSLTSGE